MKQIRIVGAGALLFLVAACSPFGPRVSTGPATGPQVAPKVATAQAAAEIDVSAFVDPKIADKLSAKDRAEAASAQFYALQFGRPAAPRDWQGQSGVSGRVTVGPFVRVNQLDCRDFTHVVSANNATYSRAGLACRDVNGVWTVVQTAG